MRQEGVSSSRRKGQSQNGNHTDTENEQTMAEVSNLPSNMFEGVRQSSTFKCTDVLLPPPSAAG